MRKEIKSACVLGKIKESAKAGGKCRQQDKLRNYNQYDYSGREFILYTGEGILLAAGVGYLFYGSIVITVCMMPFVSLFLKHKKTALIRKREQELNLQFKEAIAALSAALNAGYSVENSIRESLKDLIMLYGKENHIIHEFRYMEAQLEMNVTMEALLSNFAERSGLEDIRSFAEVFSIAKRGGGDLISIIRSTSQNISDKIEVKREILTQMSAKRLEQQIMNLIPFFIIIYVKISSPGFLDPLYGNLAGFTVMTICLLLYAASYILSSKIVGIEV